MRKTLLTLALALTGFFASAQFSVMSTINQPEGNDGWSMDNFSNNLSIGYQLNSDMLIGVQKNGEDYDLMGRYSLDDNAYVSAQMPTSMSLDSLTVGIGYSIKFWNNMYIEPNYTMSKDGDGEFKVGVAYRFE